MKVGEEGAPTVPAFTAFAVCGSHRTSGHRGSPSVKHGLRRGVGKRLPLLIGATSPEWTRRGRRLQPEGLRDRSAIGRSRAALQGNLSSILGISLEW